MFGHKIVEMLDRIIELEPFAKAIGSHEQRMMQSLMMAAGSNLSNHFDQLGYCKAAKSVKAILTDGHRFYADATPPSVKIKDFDKEELRLPYQMFNLLFEDPYDKIKTCFCCREITVSDGRWMPLEMFQAADFMPYFWMQVVYEEKETGLYEIGNMIYFFGEKDGATEVMTVEQKFADGFLNAPGSSSQNQQRAIAIAEEFIGVLLGYLQMLHCNNVVTESEPAPVKLNKKRKKKGRPPLFEYKILKMKLKNGKTCSMYGETGTGTSPRLHYRRGYFGHRWKGTGENKKLVRVWVSPCMVGREDKGIIKKDYKTEVDDD